ncbi:MAG: Sir2 family NAD-dependent protein deacetylase [Deltaproteobacteria bacterium]|nr:Sir2 family NAD-dependent protein deacetylase [Deltaproteobacteria bacterium]MBW2093131.1 Sir2 family NAD-dependent protein deacetylase [Deltaproteobacteria bacterium]
MTTTDQDLEDRIQTLAQWIAEAERLVIFTGAGISTDSGLPDFRGPDGVWTRRDKGLAPRPRDRDWTATEPNEGHMAIVDLMNMGKLAFLISQNIDNLHLKSGIPFDMLAELHGNLARLRCVRCEKTYPKSEGVEKCECGGDLKSSVVDFGDSLPSKDLMESFEHSQKCDLFIVVGSSLVVTPAATMPRVAMEAGAKLIIINQGETPFDRVCHLRFEEGITDVLPKAIQLLKEKIAN